MSRNLSDLNTAVKRVVAEIEAPESAHLLDDRVSSHSEWVSPARAEGMYRAFKYERNRPTSRDNVRRLASEMRRGTFVAGTPIFLCVMKHGGFLPDGTRLPPGSARLANGHHTLLAIIESGVTLKLTIIKCDVPDWEAIGPIYAAQDRHKARTAKDTIHAMASFDRFPMIKEAMAAAPFFMFGFRDLTGAAPSTLSDQQRLTASEPYRLAATALQGWWKSSLPENKVVLYRRAPVFAVALVTTDAQPDKAKEFWTGLAKGSGLEKGDPRFGLLRFLKNTAGAGHAARRENLLGVASAWNAWFRGKRQEYPKRDPDSFSILGTEWALGPTGKEG